MCRIINKTQTGKKIIEIHNRPYLVNTIFKKTQNKVITLFFHNDPVINERLKVNKLKEINYYKE